MAGQWIEGDLGFDTHLVHDEVAPDEKTGAILTPVYQSTTFVQESVDKYLQKGFSYSRTSNPTVLTLEKKVAATENGAGSACFGTGMAATTALFAGFLKSGEHCVITNCSYGGTNRIARVHFQESFNIQFSFVDFADLAEIEKAIIPGKTKMIFSETPTNPLLTLADLDAISALAKKHGCLHVCDPTFATPIVCRPLDHGVDICIISLTKYYDGHNVGTGGALVAKTPELHERCKFVQNMHGSIMAPQVAFHILQSMKTMGLRVRQQCATAVKIAAFLQTHPKVTKVVYPSLDSHPQRALAEKYHRDNMHGGMLWFDVAGGSPAGKKLMDNINRPWSLCENLGATESIITACAVMTHANMLKEDREKIGITDGFIRVSCGIEDAEDLIRALKKALDTL